MLIVVENGGKMGYNPFKERRDFNGKCY